MSSEAHFARQPSAAAAMMARSAGLVDLGDRIQHLFALSVIEQIAKVVIPADGVEAVDRIGSGIGRLCNLTSP
jgi:hypothetical protein